MIKKYTLVIFTILLTLSACGLIAPNKFEINQRTPGAKINDNIIENSINRQIKKQKLNQGNHINVTAFNAIVLLTGEVQDKQSNNAITKIAKSIYQVRKVHNQIRIIAPSALTARASDTLITTHISAKILGDSKTRSAETEVVSENGVAYLLGIVSKEQAEKIVHIAKSVSGVQRIVKLFEYH